MVRERPPSVVATVTVAVRGAATVFAVVRIRMSLFPVPDSGDTWHQGWSLTAVHPRFEETETVWSPPSPSKMTSACEISSFGVIPSCLTVAEMLVFFSLVKTITPVLTAVPLLASAWKVRMSSEAEVCRTQEGMVVTLYPRVEMTEIWKSPPSSPTWISEGEISNTSTPFWRTSTVRVSSSAVKVSVVFRNVFSSKAGTWTVNEATPSPLEGETVHHASAEVTDQATLAVRPSVCSPPSLSNVRDGSERISDVFFPSWLTVTGIQTSLSLQNAMTPDRLFLSGLASTRNWWDRVSVPAVNSVIHSGMELIL